MVKTVSLTEQRLPRYLTGESFAFPAPNNDNWRLMPDWMTPAEFMQWVRQQKERLRRELATDFRLRHCPEHRKTWDITLAMEQCGLWHYYNVR